jgi:hypothetical protein
MKTITIHTAAIEHRHGTNTYASIDKAAIRKDIAAYCEDEWENEMGDEPMPEDPEKRIEVYFDQVDDEFLTTDNHTIDLPEPCASAHELLAALKDLIDGAEEGLRNCESDANDGVEGAQEAYDNQTEALQKAQDLIARLDPV